MPSSETVELQVFTLCTNYAFERSGTDCDPSDLNCLCQDIKFKAALNQCPQMSDYPPKYNGCFGLFQIERFFAKADRESEERKQREKAKKCQQST